MELRKIDDKTYNEELTLYSEHLWDRQEDSCFSLDRKYKLQLEYAGEYPHGDSWHYGKIIELASGETIWEYKKGDQIRQLSYYPWSADSTSCYFTIINLGDRILQYDITKGKLKTIFGSKIQNKLKGILFVPRNFNGVVFYDNGYDKVIQPDIYCYLSDNETYIKINDEIEDEKFIISECGIKDSVILFCQDNIKIFDTAERKITGQFPIDNSDLKSYERGIARYVHKADKIYLSVLARGRWGEYKLGYRD